MAKKKIKRKPSKTLMKKLKLVGNGSVLKRARSHSGHLMSKRRNVAKARSKSYKVEKVKDSPLNKLLKKLA